MPLRTIFTSVSVRARKFVHEAAAYARRLHTHFQNPPPTPFRRELLLTLTTLQTGVLDAATFIGFGLFVANMTGNVVLLGISIAGLYQHDVTPNIIALIAFFVGGGLTGLDERISRQRELGYTRSFFASLTMIHCALYFIAAALIFTHTIPADTTSSLRLIIFALLALGQGSQVVVSKRAGLPEFTTAVVTSTIADLSVNTSFVQVTGKGMRGQLRRAASVIALFVGSIVGGETFKYQGFGVAIFVAGGISCVTVLGWSL
jgi:uncharacterized membrane protein YoaK (UPF0700 family)